MIEASDSELVHQHALWSLIETRAEVEPEGLFLLDEIGRQVTFGGYQDQAEATEITQTFPRNPAGKVLKEELKALYRQ